MHHPFTCMVSGMTGSGKTYLVKQLLEQCTETITPAPDRIVWVYAQDQPLYNDMRQSIPGIEFVSGIPENITDDDYFDVSKNNVLVLDDMMTHCHNDDRITKLFSVGSHHRNLSIFHLVQNVFHQGKETRNISLNTHYLIVFKNPRDNQQVQVLGRQMYPRKTKFFMEAFDDATSSPYGYLFLDLKPCTLEPYRVRSNILPGQRHYACIPSV